MQAPSEQAGFEALNARDQRLEAAAADSAENNDNENDEGGLAHEGQPTHQRTGCGCLDSQALATFGPTGTQDGTTTTGFLANQETVSSFTTANGGLVSTLHDRCEQLAKGFSQISPLLESDSVPFVNLKCAACG